MLAHSAQSRDPIAVCRSRSHAAFRHTGHPKQHSPSSSWSTKCATSFSPSTAPTFRTRHENNGNHRRPIGRSSRTTNCHSDRRHQLKTGPSAPFAFCQLQQSAAQTVHRRYAGTSRCPNTSANKYGFTPAPTFEDGDWGRKFPTVVVAWRRAWDQVIPFFTFPPTIRRVIYATNAIESINARLRKNIKTRGHFPADDAASPSYSPHSRDSRTEVVQPPGIT